MNRNSSLLVSLVIFLTSFMHVSNFSNYVLSLRIGYVQWHFWAAAIVMCVALAVFSGRAFKVPKPWLPYLYWAGLFLGVCALSILVVDSGTSAIQAMVSYGWFFASSLVLLLIIRNPMDIKACGLGVVAGVILLAVLSIMEFLDPNFQVIVDAYFEDKVLVGEVNRVGALYENSNENGIAMVLGMFVGQFFLPVRLRFLFFIIVGAAVFGTVSRTSITIWALAVVLSLMLGYGSKSRLTGLFGLGLVVFLGYLLVSGQVPILMTELGMGELLSTDMRNRLSENFFTQQDGSTQARLQVAQDAWRLFVENPFKGIGVGTSDAIDGLGTHNQHLKIASELGILGFLVYAGLTAVAVYSRSLVALIFLLLYTAIGFTNHGMMNYTVHAVLIPTALVFIPALHKFEKEQRKSTRKKRRRRRSSKSVAARDLSEYA